MGRVPTTSAHEADFGEILAAKCCLQNFAVLKARPLWGWDLLWKTFSIGINSKWRRGGTDRALGKPRCLCAQPPTVQGMARGRGWDREREKERERERERESVRARTKETESARGSFAHHRSFILVLADGQEALDALLAKPNKTA